MQDMNSLAKGKSLFQSGLLSEAVLALEAEVQRQPQNVEAWRLLGTVHAENDDDQQVRPSSSLSILWRLGRHKIRAIVSCTYPPAN